MPNTFSAHHVYKMYDMSLCPWCRSLQWQHNAMRPCKDWLLALFAMCATTSPRPTSSCSSPLQPAADPPNRNNQAAFHVPHQICPGESSTKQACETPPSDTKFYTIGRDLQNSSVKHVQKILCSFFGYGAEVSMILWNILLCFALLLSEAQIIHLFWMLFP